MAASNPDIATIFQGLGTGQNDLRERAPGLGHLLTALTYDEFDFYDGVAETAKLEVGAYLSMMHETARYFDVGFVDRAGMTPEADKERNERSGEIVAAMRDDREVYVFHMAEPMGKSPFLALFVSRFSPTSVMILMMKKNPTSTFWVTPYGIRLEGGTTTVTQMKRDAPLPEKEELRLRDAALAAGKLLLFILDRNGMSETTMAKTMIVFQRDAPIQHA